MPCVSGASGRFDPAMKPAAVIPANTNSTNTTASVSPPRTKPGNATAKPAAAPSATARASSLEATWSERTRQTELAGVEHAVGVERLLQAGQHIECRSEGLGYEA